MSSSSHDAPGHPAAAAPAGSPDNTAGAAAAAVLTDRALWRLVTDFQTGYPFVMHSIRQQGDVAELTRRSGAWNVQHLFRDCFSQRGLFLHLAIAAGDVDAFRKIYVLAQHPHYRDDEKLDRSCVTSYAILYNRVEILDCIGELKVREPEATPWEPHLMALAMQLAETVDLAVLDWLDVHVPLQTSELPRQYLLSSAAAGRLDIVHWLRERRCRLTRETLNRAAMSGHAHMLEYLYKQTQDRCTASAINFAARRGYLDVIKVAVANQRRATAQSAINSAAEGGKMEIVKFLVESGIRLNAPRVIDFAASSGNVELVKYLHERFPSACTPRALDNAAWHGSVDVVAFLLEHRSEGSLTSALRRAVELNRVEVVRFLHARCTHFECPPSTFDTAAKRGHLEIVRFLHANCAEDCTPNALNWAAKYGRLDVVQFLCENRLEGDVEVALKRAAGGHYLDVHLDVVQYLHSRLQPGQSAFPALALAASKSFGWGECKKYQEICAFLLDNERADEPMCFRERAASTSREAVLSVIRMLRR